MGILRIVVILVLAHASAQAWQAASATQTRPAVSAGTAEVRGRVVVGAARTPVPAADVRLSSSTGLIMSAKTDADGRFVITKVPAGQYTVSVSSNGLAVTAFGASVARTVVIDLEDGAHVDRGDLIMPSGVAISGVILDADGNPLKGANVSAWRVRYLTPGQRRLDFAGQAISDATGDYRIDGMKPGTYYVDAKVGEANAPTFFPATTDARMAAPIRITADVGAAGISIRLLPTRLARVSGVVLDAQGQPSSRFIVMLSPVRSDGAQVSLNNLMSEVDGAGKFTIDKVPPGSYSVEAFEKTRLEAVAKTGRSAEGMDTTESGSVPVTVDGVDVNDIVIGASLPTTLIGRVTLDGASITAQLASRVQITITANSLSAGALAGMKATTAAPQPDGTFSARVIPGGRLISVYGSTPGITLARVLVDGVDVMDEGFEVGNSEMRNVEVALTSKPTAVTGRITDGQGQPQGSVGIIVFSEDARHWTRVFTRRVVSARAKADGTFAIGDLPAGSYFAAVVPTLVEGEWAEPSNLEQLRATATSFKLTDGEQKSLMLTWRR